MPVSIDFARIREVQRKARVGDYGEWRRDFSRRFREMLEGIYAEIKTEVANYTQSTGQQFTCSKGCGICCEQFISVPVTHAVIVTEYLYASEKAMSAFLRGYERWLRSFEDTPEAAALLSSLELCTTSTAEVISPPQDLLSAYHKLSIPCPFLEAQRCSIYPVRPICCAAYFAVSPVENCRAGSEIPAAVFEVTPSRANLRKLAQLTDPRLAGHQEPLPTLVYKLLTRGLPEAAAEVELLFNAEPRTLTETGPQK